MSSHLNSFRAEHADPWGDSPDVLSLNKAASDAIVDAVKQVRDAARKDTPPSSVITILGPAGVGKTHLFQRLRRQCGAKAAFVLLRPNLAAPSTPRNVLLNVLDSLLHPPMANAELQLDVMVGAFLTECDPLTSKWPQVLLSEYRSRSADEVDRLIEAGVDLLEDRFGGEISTDYLELLLRVPFMSRADRRAALNWLSGREPSETWLKRLGRTQPLSDPEVLPALRTLSAVASFGAPIVLVFDQLENLIEPGADQHRVIAHANLVAELFDTMRGMVLVQMGLDAEWRRRFRPVLSDAQRSRLERQLIDLTLPNPRQKEELLQNWIAGLPEEDRANPFPFPFSDEQVSKWLAQEGLTPRRLMLACRDVLDGTAEEDSPVDAESEGREGDSLKAHLEQLWQAHLRVIRSELTEVAAAGQCLDDTRLLSGMFAAFELVESTTRQHVDSRKLRGIHLEHTGNTVRIYALQQPHHLSVAAALKRLTEEAGQTPIVAIREWTQEFPPTWKAVQKAADAFDSAPKGSLHWIAPDEVAQLLALHDLLRSARSQDVTSLTGEPIPSEDIVKWLREELPWREWEVMRRLLRALGFEVVDEEPSSPELSAGPPALPDQVDTQPQAPLPPTRDAATTALAVLERLRLASVERLVREVRHGDSSITRARILAELREAGDDVQWFGRDLIGVRAVFPAAVPGAQA